MDTFDDDTSPTAKRGACYVDAMMDESPMAPSSIPSCTVSAQTEPRVPSEPTHLHSSAKSHIFTVRS